MSKIYIMFGICTKLQKLVQDFVQDNIPQNLVTPPKLMCHFFIQKSDTLCWIYLMLSHVFLIILCLD